MSTLAPEVTTTRSHRTRRRPLRGIASWALAVFVASVPLEAVVTVPGVGTVSRLFGLVAVATCTASVVRDGRRRPFVDVQVLLGVLVLVAIASWTWSVAAAETTGAVVTLVQLWVMVALLWEFGEEQQHRRRFVLAYVVGAWVAAVGTCIAFATGTVALEGDYGERFAAGGANPNDIGFILALACPMAWHLSLRARSTALVWFLRLYLVAAPAAVVLTASRTAFVLVFLGLAAIPLTLDRLTPPGRLALVVVAVVLGVAASAYVPDFSAERLGTIATEWQEGNLSLRRPLWETTLEITNDHPVLGVGAGASRVEIERRLGLLKGPHNTFLEVASELGVIGFGLFGLALLAVLKRTRAYDRAGRHCTLVLLTQLAIGLMTLHWLGAKDLWIVLAVATDGLGADLRRVPRRAGVAAERADATAALTAHGAVPRAR